MPVLQKAVRGTVGVASAIKDLRRFQEIAGVLARNGLGMVLENIQLPGLEGLLRRRDEPVRPLPERLVSTCEELGPTFIKLGQFLSTRGDLVPKEIAIAFERLQDRAQQVPVAEIRRQIEDALGKGVHEVFTDFEDEPIATASMAQVHRARTPGDHLVAVKVLRPGVRKIVETDLSILAFLARQAQVGFPDLQLLDLEGIFTEFRRALRAETDLTLEARNMARFSLNFAERPFIVIPTVDSERTAPTVLTMEYLDGVPIRRFGETEFDGTELGQAFLDAAFAMLFQDGFFHGDLHPGNVFVLSDGRLALLDFGMVGYLTPAMRDQLVTILFALSRNDVRMVARVFWDLGVHRQPVQYAAFERDVQRIVDDQVAGRSLGEIEFSAAIAAVLEGALVHRIQAPPDYTVFFKALLTAEGLGRMLAPNLNPVEAARPYIEELVRQRYDIEKIRDEALFLALEFREVAKLAPIVVGQMSRDYLDGRFRFPIEVVRPSEERDEEMRRARLLRQTIVAASALVAAALVMPEDGLPMFGAIGTPLLFIGMAIGILALGRRR